MMWRYKIQNNSFKHNCTYKINSFSNKKPNQNQNGNSFLNIKQSLVSNIKVGFEHIKGTLIEVMAKRMNESDIVKMKNYWVNRIDTTDAVDSINCEISLDKIKEQKLHSKELPHPHKIKDIPLVSKHLHHIDIFDRLKHDLNCITEDVHLYHPLLGEKIADLGYKKLFLTNVQSLIFTPVWKKQRILRPERATLIAKEKVKNGLATSLNGSIVLYMHRKTNEIGIIDGQHRAAALMILSQQGYWDEVKRNVLLEVFTVDSMTQITTLFREINSAEPVRLIDMLEHEGDSNTTYNQMSSQSLDTSISNNKDQVNCNVVNREVIEHKSFSDTNKEKKIQQSIQPLQLLHEDCVMIINESVDFLSKTYPDMFKPSSRCKPPHMNMDVLRDELFRSEYIQKHEIVSSKSLIKKLLETNQYEKMTMIEKKTNQHHQVSSSKSFHIALEKAIEHDFYLGLDKGWMYR